MAFGFKTINDIDKALRENGNAAVRMSQYSMSDGDDVKPGYCIVYLFMVLGAKLGHEKYYQMVKGYKFSSASKAGLKNMEDFYWSAVVEKPKST